MHKLIFEAKKLEMTAGSSGVKLTSYTVDCIPTGTAVGQVHVYDVNDYQWVCSWSFNDAGTPNSDNQVTSVAYSMTTGDVAVAVASTVKIWNLRSVSSSSDILVTSAFNFYPDQIPGY
jgi:hypothetical protein